MFLLIDNYDSFTFNLFQLMTKLGAEVEVVRNDEITMALIDEMQPEGIVISPGPGTPEKAGLSGEIVARFGPAVPILGVCLGHQCIAEAYGGTVVVAPELMHGKSSLVYHTGQGIFEGLESPMPAIRYHSLTLDPATVPDCLEVTAQTDNGTIMGLRHREYDVEGVQFHPESIMTPLGPQLMENWLRRVASKESDSEGHRQKE
ncbi:MAG TPA: aminodeoxychorismate/anthranilate synthase component II [Chloroflexota bacterium]|jgi:anthranilate synthase/aminodeoxychorismate synthase-like glutamine amidotransferase|nr:aminodeoxychorismate/anthranilate synthase component II [Chloroflexota bacterium]